MLDFSKKEKKKKKKLGNVSEINIPWNFLQSYFKNSRYRTIRIMYNLENILVHIVTKWCLNFTDILMKIPLRIRGLFPAVYSCIQAHWIRNDYQEDGMVVTNKCTSYFQYWVVSLFIFVIYIFKILLYLKWRLVLSAFYATPVSSVTKLFRVATFE